jgi:metallo-beta-lactamase class B
MLPLLSTPSRRSFRLPGLAASLLVFALALLSVPARAQDAPNWSEPFAAHRIIDNVYYVGSRGLASYLIATSAGHILINSSLVTSPPLIRKSVEDLGFKFSDIKILLISHAHWDHCAGSAEIIKLTGARYMVMTGDAAEVESGGRENFFYANQPPTFYAPAKVDRVLRDGDEVRLGETVLVARHTPGHTRGTTTWTMKVRDAGKTLDAVIIGSPNVNAGYVLVGNPRYPEIADDFAKGFQVLKSLPCDVFLGAHGDYYRMEAKLARQKADPAAANPFIDPEGYKNYVAARERAFLSELTKQRATAK